MKHLVQECKNAVAPCDQKRGVHGRFFTVYRRRGQRDHAPQIKKYRGVFPNKIVPKIQKVDRVSSCS